MYDILYAFKYRPRDDGLIVEKNLKMVVSLVHGHLNRRI